MEIKVVDASKKQTYLYHILLKTWYFQSSCLFFTYYCDDQNISYQSHDHDNSKNHGDQQTCQYIQLFIPNFGFVLRQALHGCVGYLAHPNWDLQSPGALSVVFNITRDGRRRRREQSSGGQEISDII